MLIRKSSVIMSCILMLIGLTACAGGKAMKPTYPKSAVKVVEVKKASENEVIFRFSEVLESMYYSAGVSYQKQGDTIHVVIDRCPIRGECNTMVRAPKPLQPGELNVIRLPYSGEKIVVEYADAKEQVFP